MQEKRPVESPAHGIADRESVDTPLQTGTNVSMLSSLSDVVSANLLSVTVAQAKLLLLLILLLTKKASVLSAFM